MDADGVTTASREPSVRARVASRLGMVGAPRAPSLKVGSSSRCGIDNGPYRPAPLHDVTDHGHVIPPVALCLRRGSALDQFEQPPLGTDATMPNSQGFARAAIGAHLGDGV